MKKKALIAPSILSADFSKINKEIMEIAADADLIHVDVMDGVFVEAKTFDAKDVAKIKAKLPLDVHLMVENPEEKIELYAKAGAAIITVHYEAIKNNEKIFEVIEKIHALNCRAGISINPDTELEKILPFAGKVDMVLIMGVFPGKAGQSFMPSVLEKIKKLRKLKPDLDIEVDGGITAETASAAAEAGANIFVAGSAIFGKKDRKAAILEIRKRIEESR